MKLLYLYFILLIIASTANAQIPEHKKKPTPIALCNTPSGEIKVYALPAKEKGLVFSWITKDSTLKHNNRLEETEVVLGNAMVSVSGNEVAIYNKSEHKFQQYLHMSCVKAALLERSRKSEKN